MATTYLFNLTMICVMTLIFFSTLLAYLIYTHIYKNQVTNILKNDVVYNVIKSLLLYPLTLSFLVYIIFLFKTQQQVIMLHGLSLFNEYSASIPLNKESLAVNNYIEFTTDLFGNVVLFLAYFVGILSLLALDNRIFWKNIKYLISINVFVLIVFFYVCSNNIIMFFLFYELLLLPSFLLVYFISPSRRAIQASLYFLIWTQLGSFLVLLTVIYIVVLVGSANYFDIKTYNFSYTDVWLIYVGLFIGFGFKVPLWPLHYWLTKTHVEAPSGFSMYLSGFLVKSAVYGFYKMSCLLNNDVNSTIFVSICVIGVCDASLKMWCQTDLKKLVAYGTIQEMNLIYLAFMWGDTNAILGGILFCITHGALSTLMFFLVDCLYRRFNSRSVIELSGILQINPILGTTIIIMCMLYAGLPGTLKFSCEFYIFCGLFEASVILCITLFFIANVLGLIGFSKCWFDAVFGLITKNLKIIPFDLTLKELYILYIPIILLILFAVSPTIFI